MVQLPLVFCSSSPTEHFMSKVFRNYKIFFVWLLITAASPFMFYSFSWHPYKLLITVILLFFSASFFFKGKVKINDKFSILILGIQIFYSFVCIYYYDDPTYMNLVVQFLSLTIIYAYINTFLDIKVFSHSIVLFMLALGGLGAAAFFLAILGVIQPSEGASYMHGSVDRSVINYCMMTFTNISIELGSGRHFIRVAGYFNEPGAMAFFLTQALLMNKLIFDNKRIEWLLIFFGFFTFSIAYFISVVLYGFMFYFNGHFLRKVTIVLLLFSILFGSVYTFREKNEELDMIAKFTIDRLALSDSGDKIFVGDTRSDKFKSNYQYFVNHPVMGYGMKEFYKIPDYVGGAIIDILVRDGLIGVFFYFLHSLYFAWRGFFKNYILHSDSAPIKAAILIFINYIQRPYPLGIFNYVIILMLTLVIRKRQFEPKVLMEFGR